MPNVFVVDSVGGISGSLHHLVDGSSYLIAGDHISIVSQSNGSVLISLSGSFTIANINVSGSSLGFYSAPPVPQHAIVPQAESMAAIGGGANYTVWFNNGIDNAMHYVDSEFDIVSSKIDDLRIKLNQVTSLLSQVSGGVGITA